MVRVLAFGLGEGDPVVIRQVLKKIGVTAITVWPEGDDWQFEGTADFGATLQRRSTAAPPEPPTGYPRRPYREDRLRGQKPAREPW